MQNIGPRTLLRHPALLNNYIPMVANRNSNFPSRSISTWSELLHRPLKLTSHDWKKGPDDQGEAPLRWLPQDIEYKSSTAPSSPVTKKQSSNHS